MHVPNRRLRTDASSKADRRYEARAVGVAERERRSLHKCVTASSRYDQPIDPTVPNNSHSFALQLVGWNQRVLELGAASGHVTRALAAQGCRVTAVEYDPEAASDIDGLAEQVIVGDLNDPATLAELPAEFDVVLAGDVLEHLIDPQAVLNRMVQLLVPHGRVVVSVPHVGHVDVRLSLLQGRFDYGPWGLLDRTHLRFFTLKTIRDMVRKAGLLITELRRVRVPAFESELGVDRLKVATAVLEEIFADPEAESYQFVFSAVRATGDYDRAQLIELVAELRAEHERSAIAAAYQAVGIGELERELDGERCRREAAESSLAALHATKLVRYTRVPRKLYGAFMRNWR